MIVFKKYYYAVSSSTPIPNMGIPLQNKVLLISVFYEVSLEEKVVCEYTWTGIEAGKFTDIILQMQWKLEHLD